MPLACRYLRRFRYFTTADRAIRTLATAIGDPVTRFEPLECADCGAIHIWDKNTGPPTWHTRRVVINRTRSPQRLPSRDAGNEPPT